MFYMTYLQGDDVSVAPHDVGHDALLPIIPVEGPGGAVGVHGLGAELIGQDVVAHDGEHRRRHLGIR